MVAERASPTCSFPARSASPPISSGRVQSPQLTGVIRANNLTFVHETYGTRITAARPAGPLHQLRASRSPSFPAAPAPARSPAPATVGFAAAAGYPIDIRLKLAQRPARPQRLDRRDPHRRSRHHQQPGQRRADLGRSDPARGPLPDHPPGRRPGRRAGRASAARASRCRAPAPPTQQADAAPSIWKLDLRLRADNQLFISGMGLESEWSADLRVQGTTATPAITRQGRSDPRHVQLRGRASTSAAAISPSPATGRPIRASTSSPAPTSRTSRSTSTSRRQRQQPADRLHLLAGAAAGRDHRPDPVRRLGDRDFGAAGGPARQLAQLASRRRRRPQPARQAALRRPASTGFESSAPTTRPAAAPPSPPASTSATTSISRSSPTPAASPPPRSRSLCPRR